MAARRLIALLVALLLISTIATALAPPQEAGEESGTTSTTTEEPTPDDARTGEPGVVTASIDASADKAKAGTPIEAEVGDQLALSVRSPGTSQIEIPALGLYGTAAPGAPALFDVVLREEGRLDVLADGDVAGTILIGTDAQAGAKPSDEREPKETRPKGKGSRDGGSPVAA
jgi:hypothetical protein